MEKLDEGIEMKVLCSLDNLSVDLIYVQPNAVESCVYHKQLDEVLYILNGRIEVILDGEKKIYEEGECVAISKMTRHVIKNIGQSLARILAICSPKYTSEDSYICK